MNNDYPKGAKSDASDVKRGPNEESATTAQENVSQGYGSSAKASIISGKPDSHAERNHGEPTRDKP